MAEMKTDRAGMHRRAQKAEGALARAAGDAEYWKATWWLAVKREAKFARQLVQANAELRWRRLRDPDTLQRIIALGEEYP